MAQNTEKEKHMTDVRNYIRNVKTNHILQYDVRNLLKNTVEKREKEASNYRRLLNTKIDSYKLP